MSHSHVASVWKREYTNCIIQRLYRPICARPARLLPITLAEREVREGRLGPCKTSISLRKFLQQLPLCACHATNVMGTCIRELCVVTAVHMCMYVSEGDGGRS